MQKGTGTGKEGHYAFDFLTLIQYNRLQKAVLAVFNINGLARCQYKESYQLLVYLLVMKGE